MTKDTQIPGYNDGSLDLTNCDREPIHLLGHVQSFACLIAVTSDWLITRASQNTKDFLGLEPAGIFGRSLTEFFSEQAIHDLRSRMQLMWDEDAVERAFDVALLPDSDEKFDVAIHRSGAEIVMECQKSDLNRNTDQGSVVRPIIGRLKNENSVDAVCQQASRFVRSLTGFDRVMVYKFRPDDSGEVIAETTRAGLDPFLGLRYPASDIPKQARALYKRNLLRIISDVDDKVSPILQQSNNAGPLDLSLSASRAVSPIHLEYLRNMGVKASMSISIVIRGKLWGMFACHHYEPRILNYGIRSAAELFAQMFSFVLERIENDIEREEAVRARILHDQLMSQLAEGQSLAQNFEVISDAMRALIKSDGAALWVDGEFLNIGHTPSKDQFTGLARHLNVHPSSQIIATNCIADDYPDAIQFQDKAAGMLVLPVSRTPRDYIVFFRRELVQEVRWAGNPEKPVDVGPNGVRLTPRGSFAAWKEIVSGQSADWTAGEIAGAEALRVTLLEVVLRISDAASRERVRSQERQELLIAELNHRVRNILNLIRSLVSQSKQSAGSISEFTEIIGGRIHALARAHDQLTNKNWDSTPLRELVNTELEAYIGLESGRVQCDCPEVLLTPFAFSTLALVIHELTTNSVKYGCLSNDTGVLMLSGQKADNGDLIFNWKETGGPAVQAPTRSGFGSTVIERSIPFELKGEANVRFEVNGLEANMRIPAEFVEFAEREITATEAAIEAKEDAKPASASLSGPALVVEDNMIIALDAEDMLMALGADSVEIASSVSEALQLIEKYDFSFAILDVNLGSETSEPIAHKVKASGIPFVFATGYGESQALADQFEGVTFIQKPYDQKAVQKAIAEMSES